MDLDLCFKTKMHSTMFNNLYFLHVLANSYICWFWACPKEVWDDRNKNKYNLFGVLWLEPNKHRDFFQIICSGSLQKSGIYTFSDSHKESISEYQL